MRLFLGLIALTLWASTGTAAAAPGDLDGSFGEGGKALADFGDAYNSGAAVALQPDGKIVVAGSTSKGAGYADFAVARLQPNGSLDSSFGVGGRVVLDITGGEDICRAVALQPDGKIVVAGSSPGASGSDFSIARLLPNGSLDTYFGNGGKSIADFKNGDDAGIAVGLQADTKIVVAGVSSGGSGASGGPNFAVARLQPNGYFDTPFGDGGTSLADFSDGGDIGRAVALDPDGRIVVGGDTYSGARTSRWRG